MGKVQGEPSEPRMTQKSARARCVCVCVCECVLSSRLQPARLLCPWDFPGKNTGVGCHFLLQGIFPT